jgi:hypothetical protein
MPRRHHNRTGYRQIKRGKTVKQVADMVKRLKIKTVQMTSVNGETVGREVKG